MAAYSAGAKRVIIPAENMRDLEEIDPLARENLEFIPCRKLSEVLEEALVPAKSTAQADIVSAELVTALPQTERTAVQA